MQLGGVYALERVAKDSPRDRAVSIEVLSAFVRQQSKARGVRTDERANHAREATSDLTGLEGGRSEPMLAALYVCVDGLMAVARTPAQI